MSRSLLALLLSAGLAQAAPSSLLRWVPDDAGFVAVATDLAKHASAVGGSPFAKLAVEKLGKDAVGPKELAKLAKAAEEIRKAVGLEWADLADVAPGEALAFAYRPGPAGKPEEEGGLFLLRSRKAGPLAALVDSLNKLQGATLEEVEHGKMKYLRRSEKEGPKTYYLIDGPTLVFSVQEDMLKRAIDAFGKSKESPAALDRLRSLGLEDAPVAVVANPRAFDHLLPESKPLRAYWTGLRAVGLALHLDRDASLRLAFEGSTKGLPAAGKKFLEAPVKVSALWAAIPKDPLLAVTGQIDLAGAWAALGELVSAAQREAMEKQLADLGRLTGIDLAKDALPALGPDWGAWLAVPEGKEAVPRLAAAFKVRSTEMMDESLLPAMQGWATVAVANLNRSLPADSLARLAAPADRDKLRRIECKAFPAGLVPAWGVRAGYLVAGSSPAALAELGKAAVSEGKGAVPLVRVSFGAWLRYATEQREAFVAHLMRDGSKKEEASAKLDALRKGLELLDRLDLTREASEGKVAFTLRLKLAAPLRK